MKQRNALPVIAIVCSFKRLDIPGFGPLGYHAAFEKYVDTIATALPCVPLLIPAVGSITRAPVRDLVERWLDSVDGIVLTGAISNVAPDLYGGALTEPLESLDIRRDATTLPLIRGAVAKGVPILGLCRGMQEINVALGGTLIQRVHEISGRRDHRAPKGLPLSDRYYPAHPLRPVLGGWLDRLLTEHAIPRESVEVNSLHGQAVDRLGEGVVVEALADDGTIEAIRIATAPGFALGVQWHAEWHLDETPLHRAILGAFARSCSDRAMAAS